MSTVNGTSTLRFDQAGKPLTVALPYGETPWVRITAVATDDGSAGVQFGITDFTVTQYDAKGFAHPVNRAIPSLSPRPRRIRLSRNGIWGQNCSGGRVVHKAPTAPGARRRWRCRRRSR